MISAVIPYRPQSGRTDAFGFVREYLEANVDEVIVADDGKDPFSRGCSINEGVRRASGDILVICDADLILPERQLDAAVVAVACRLGMVLPFDRYHYLTGAATLDVLAGVSPHDDTPVEFVMETSLGGVCVIDRKTFNRCGGFDPAMRGWGHEDNQFFSVVDTLATVSRVPGPIFHLWHPLDPVRPKENLRILAPYVAAHGNPEAMLALIGDRSC